MRSPRIYSTNLIQSKYISIILEYHGETLPERDVDKTDSSIHYKTDIDITSKRLNQLQREDPISDSKSELRAPYTENRLLNRYLRPNSSVL
jgi:hypothetical protein